MNRTPTSTPTDAALERAAEIARAFVAGLPERPVAPTVPLDELRRRFGGPLPESGEDPVLVVEALAANAEGGLIATAGPRFFGFVIGGQRAGGAGRRLADQRLGPERRPVRHRPGRRGRGGGRRAAGCAELFGLPAGVSVGLHDGRDDGLVHRARGRAPRAARAGRAGTSSVRACSARREIPVVVSDESHVTIFAALQMLGMGRDRVIRVATDEQGRMRADALRDALAATRTAGARRARRRAT